MTTDYVMGMTVVLADGSAVELGGPRLKDVAGLSLTAYGEIMELAMGLGGTITGEHGVGRLKKPWLEDYLGPDVMSLDRRVKDALDPWGILNPGSVFG
ncbi:hypothetical protein GCM10023215_29530 [Pseudonocardia yuanmonensis]|uniref:FAD-binding oxidoreductase/transferase type 4 C-terminal domain-containing protein n=1 Tax=Pseudonocardia yuanmonensis TaxID=1095914 RepID=A0ABP8WL07_9PSEU